MKLKLRYSPSSHRWETRDGSVFLTSAVTLLNCKLTAEPWYPGKQCKDKPMLGFLEGETNHEPAEHNGKPRVWFNGRNWLTRRGEIREAEQLYLATDGKVFLLK